MTTTAAEAGPGSLWSTLREAVRGTSADFTKIPIGRAVLLLAVPMVLEMCMESVFAVADIFFVGHLHITDAISTVGFTESLMTIIYAWVVTQLWSVNPQGWMFLVLLSALNIGLDLLSIIGQSTISSVAPSIVVNGIVLIYCLTPGVKRAFGTQAVGAA